MEEKRETERKAEEKKKKKGRGDFKLDPKCSDKVELPLNLVKGEWGFSFQRFFESDTLNQEL